MPLVKSPEMTRKNLAAHQANGPRSAGPVTRPGKANSAASRLRHGFYSQPRAEALAGLGEEPEDYLRLMESLLEDLQPREGLEMHLVTQMGETLWWMQRAQRMQEGLALKRIQSKVLHEEMMTTTTASQAVANLEPFERLQEALSPRGDGPTPAEIQAFVESREEGSSPRMQEFIVLLQSLPGLKEERKRKLARRQARAELHELMEAYQSVAWRMARRAEKVHSPENIAALAAPQDDNALLLQKMEDSNLRRLWRLTNTLMKVRQGGLTPKDVNNEG